MINSNMNIITHFASKFYNINPLEVQITFSFLDEDGWQVYIQHMICDSNGQILSIRQFHDGLIGWGKSVELALEELKYLFEKELNKIDSRNSKFIEKYLQEGILSVE